MALLDYLTAEEAEPKAATILERISSQSGRRVPFLEVMAHNPHVLETRTDYFASLLGGGSIDRQTKELVYVAVSAANACEYCATTHGEELVEDHGVPVETVEAVLVGDLGSLTERERAVVDLADQMTADPKRVRESHLDALRAVGYDDADLVELAMVVATANAANLFVDAFDIHRTDVGLPSSIDYEPSASD